MTNTIRIGNASGYWGDDPTALKRQLEGGKLDYICMDFLAEVSMSILQKQRAKDANLGYAKDLLSMLDGSLKRLLETKTCLIVNAGGINPEGMATAVEELAKRLGLSVKIACVFGDDLMPNLAELAKSTPFTNLDSGAAFSSVADKVQAANAYLGSAPIVEALKHKPDIVITGRVTDTAITLAPLVHEFGWSWTDYDKLACGIAAGHIIECGNQAAGGNYTDWEKVPSFSAMGFPIAVCHADGSFEITKHPHTGGLVNADTVREQLVYEVGDLTAYLTPDVVANFATAHVTNISPDVVRVTGVTGAPPTDSYKVSLCYQDGFRLITGLLVPGPKAAKKAEIVRNMLWEVLPAGITAKEAEFVGYNATNRSLQEPQEVAEIFLRFGARANDAKPLIAFAKRVSSLILAGPPGLAVLGGNPSPQEVYTFWPTLIPKKLVQAKVLFAGHISTPPNPSIGSYKPADTADQVATSAKSRPATHKGHHLYTICLARSGDKGNLANIGVLARSPQIFAWMQEHLTAQLIKDLFQDLCKGRVRRYQSHSLMALNFILEDCLDGGGSKTLRIDQQGKTLGQVLLAQRFAVPDSLLLPGSEVF